MKTDNLLTLPDGRNLAYAEFGRPDGYPVLWCHAWPSSRLEPLMVGDDVLAEMGLRVICPDRPGVGLSDFQSDRGLSGWPKDVSFFTEAIGLDRFSVFGISGGGPYAAVCAARIPDKLNKVVIASGAWRMDWPEAAKNLGFPYNLLWRSAKHAPVLLSCLFKLLRPMIRSPKNDDERALAQHDKAVPLSEVFPQVVSEAMRQGSKGLVWDARMYVREWDFDLAEIQMPLNLFHGEQDKNVPLALVQRVANSLPSAQLQTYPEDDHVSLSRHFDEMAKALMPDEQLDPH